MRQREKRSKYTVEVAHSILVDVNNQPSLCKTKPNQTGRIWAYGHLLFVLSQSTYLLSTDDFFSKDGGGGGTEGAPPNRHPLGLIGRDITLSRAEAVTVTKCRATEDERPSAILPREWSSGQQCGKEGGGKRGTEAAVTMSDFLTGRMLSEL